MTACETLDRKGSQAEFAAMVGIRQQTVSDMVGEGVLKKGGTLLEWLRAYTERLREQAAGRASQQSTEDGEPLDLVQERAHLAREQRVSYEIKNAIARGEYAPIGLLGDVLAVASASVADRFDAVPGLLKKACPDLPSEARDAVAGVLSSARNAWVKATSELVVKSLDEMTEEG